MSCSSQDDEEEAEEEGVEPPGVGGWLAMVAVELLHASRLLALSSLSPFLTPSALVVALPLLQQKSAAHASSQFQGEMHFVYTRK